MTTGTATAVTCSNKRCQYAVRHQGNPRFIGEDYGGGGRWQCRSCGVFTVRGAVPSGAVIT